MCSKLHNLKGVDNFLGLGGSNLSDVTFPQILVSVHQSFKMILSQYKIITRVRYSGGGGGGGFI